MIVCVRGVRASIRISVDGLCLSGVTISLHTCSVGIYRLLYLEGSMVVLCLLPIRATVLDNVIGDRMCIIVLKGTPSNGCVRSLQLEYIGQ